MWPPLKGLPAKASRQQELPGKEGFPATKALDNEGPSGNEGPGNEGLLGNEGLRNESFPTRASPVRVLLAKVWGRDLDNSGKALQELPFRDKLTSRQRGTPGNDGLPAMKASRQRGPPGNEGLPATRASRQRGLPGNEGLPATSQLEAPEVWKAGQNLEISRTPKKRI